MLLPMLQWDQRMQGGPGPTFEEEVEGGAFTLMDGEVMKLQPFQTCHWDTGYDWD